MRVLNAAQMREADRRTIEDLGVPSCVLMENAGRQVVAAIGSAFGPPDGRRAVILAGRGNNGGDGFVVARGLREEQWDVVVCLAGTATDVRGDARTNLAILQTIGVPVVEVNAQDEWELVAADVLRCDLLVDALFGTGLTAPLSGLPAAIVGAVNAAGVPVVAIDLPSGLSADACAPIGPAIRADLTVTLAAPKLPLVMPPGDSAAGTVIVADIGIPQSVIASLDGPRVELTGTADVRTLLTARAPDAHKGAFGHVCLVAGSRGKTGAAYLCGMAALRSGAGLSTVATPASCVPVVASMAAEYMTLGLQETADGLATAAASALVLAGRFDVIALGPGLGTGPEQRALLLDVLARAAVPLVLDADALTALSGGADLRARAGQVLVVTPHPGEMARLTGLSVAAVQADRLGVARTYARERGVVVVLKGYRTLVAAPDGRTFINPTGNAGMATGGSGDVLTGAITGWLAQLGNPVDACRLAVYLHGAAGDIAARETGQIAMTAGDLLGCLGAATLALTDAGTSDADEDGDAG